MSPTPRCRTASLALATLGLFATACEPEMDTSRQVEPFGSFGEVIYREACQREAYLGQLEQRARGERDTVDVSGGLGKAVCIGGAMPPGDAPEKLKEMPNIKAPLVATVDAILPKPFLSDLSDFMTALQPLNDDEKDGSAGPLPAAIQSVGALLDSMAKDPAFTPAVARLTHRDGYRPTKVAAGLIHTVIEYPQIDAFFDQALGLVSTGGVAQSEFKTLLSALSMELRSAQPVRNPNDPERPLRLGLSLLFDTHPDLMTGTPRPLVKRDYRGIATVALSGGTVPLPFVDKDGDGLADVDAMGHFVDGNGLSLLVAPPFPALGTTDVAPRDDQGRAIVTAGQSQTLYDYLDLDGTILTGLLREAKGLTDPSSDKLLGLAHGLSALLGPRTQSSKSYAAPAGGMLGTLSYRGFDLTQAPILDLLHAFVQLLGDPNADQTLQSAQTLMDQYESPTARLVGAMLDASNRGAAHPEAQIPASSTLYDDLHQIIVRVLRVPGLAEDLVGAMQSNPTQLKNLSRINAWYMRSRNAIDIRRDLGPDFPLDGSTVTTFDGVDRGQPDVDNNRSLWQRIAHVIHDSNGVQFCNKENAAVALGPISLKHDAKCQLFQIDDLALFFMLNMASPAARAANPSAEQGANFCNHLTDGLVKSTINLLGEGFLETQVGIRGFTCHPSPQAQARSLFLRPSEQSTFMQNTTDPVQCKDGDKFVEVHQNSLFAWEIPFSDLGGETFYTAIQPIIDAFARHDECAAYDASGACSRWQNAGKIFLDLISVFHEHWASPRGSYSGHTYQPDPNSPRYARTDNLVSYEALVSEVMGEADLTPALIEFAPTLASFTVDGSNNTGLALPVLLGTARYVFDPDQARANGLAYRNGSTSTTQSDGVTPVASASLYHMIADSYAKKRAALDLAGPAGGSWKQATSALVDQMLTVNQTAGGTWQFQNRRFRAISLKVLDFVRRRLARHSADGDLMSWVHQKLTHDTSDLLGGPVAAAMGDFAAKVETNPGARAQLYGLLNYLVDQGSSDLVFQTALTALADQAQLFIDDPDLIPIAHVMGAALDPGVSTVDAQLTLMNRARAVDKKRALTTILRNLYKQDAQGNYPAGQLADLAAQLDRVHPLVTQPLTAEDYQHILTETRDFLLDNERGLARFTAIVKSRGAN